MSKIIEIYNTIKNDSFLAGLILLIIGEIYIYIKKNIALWINTKNQTIIKSAIKNYKEELRVLQGLHDKDFNILRYMVTKLYEVIIYIPVFIVIMLLCYLYQFWELGAFFISSLVIGKCIISIFYNLLLLKKSADFDKHKSKIENKIKQLEKIN